MGGTGSSPSDYASPPPGGDSTPEALPCDRLRFKAPIQPPPVPPSVAPAVNDVLEVVLQADEATGYDLVHVVDDRGDIVGSIVDELPRLLRCLSQGTAFIAVVARSDSLVIDAWVYAPSIAEAEGVYTGTRELDGSGTCSLEDPADRGTAIQLANESGTSELEARSICMLRALLRAGVSYSFSSQGHRVEISHSS